MRISEAEIADGTGLVAVMQVNNEIGTIQPVARLAERAKADYGEGSFDKGIYISIPFDEMMSLSTMRRANIVWAPLTRDGGARLNRGYSLQSMTDSRDSDLFYRNFEKITH